MKIFRFLLSIVQIFLVITGCSVLSPKDMLVSTPGSTSPVSDTATKTIHSLTDTPLPTFTQTLLSTPTQTSFFEPTLTPSLAAGKTLFPTQPTSTQMPQLQPISHENIAQLTEINRLGRGAAYQVAISPDGNYLAVASSLGVWLYDAITLEDIALFKTDYQISSVAFSPDQIHLAAGDGVGKIYVWQFLEGQLQSNWQAHTSPVLDLAYSPDGATLVSGGDKVLYLWQMPDGILQQTLEGHTIGIGNVAFSPDGLFIASGSGDDTVRLWSASSGALVNVLEEDGGSIHDIAFSPDSSMLASANNDGIVRLWRVLDGELVDTFEHWDTSTCVAFSPDGAILAVGTDETGYGKNTIKLWNVAGGTLHKELEGHLAGILDLAFHPNGNELFFISLDGTIKLWNILDDTPPQVTPGHIREITSLAVSADGKTLAAGTYFANLIYFWQMPTGVPLSSLESYNIGPVNSVAFSPDGNLLAVGTDAYSVYLWQLTDGSIFHYSWNLPFVVWEVSFSPDGERLAVASEGVQVRRVSDFELLTEFDTGDITYNAAFSPDGETFILSDRLLRAEDGSPIITLDDATGWEAAFSPDGEMLAITAHDYASILVYRVADGKLLHRLPGHTDRVTGLAFSPDGTILVSAAKDETARLWDTTTGEELKTISYACAILDVVFSPSDDFIALGCEDGFVGLWGIPSE